MVKVEKEIIDLCFRLLNIWGKRPIINDDEAAWVLVKIFENLKSFDEKRFYECFNNTKQE